MVPALADWDWIPRPLRCEPAVLALILFAALALRVGAGASGEIIQHDGSRFIKMARHLDRGEWGRALEIQPHMPPMYPLTIRLFALLFRDFERAAIAVAALFGALAVLPLYSIAKAVSNERIGAVAALLYAFLPEAAILHGEVMSEGLFLFFFLGWMALLWSAEREPRWTKFVLMGAAAGVAYLTRPEGIYCVAGTVGWLALRARRNVLRLAGGLACFLLVFLAIAWPYLLWIHAQTGKWKFTVNPFAEGIFERLSGKEVAEKPADRDSEFKEERARARYGRLGGALLMILRESVKVCFYVFLPIGLLGIGWARRYGFGGWGSAYLGLFIVGYGAPNVVAMMADQPFGYRYIMPPCIFATPFMAVGVLAVFGWIGRVRWLPLLLSLGMLAAMTVKTVKPRRGDRRPLKEAGQWIRSSHGPGRRVAAMDRRVEFYAEGDHVPMPQDPDRLPPDVEFLVVHDRELKHFPPDFEKRIAERYREAARFEGARVYETVPSQR